MAVVTPEPKLSHPTNHNKPDGGMGHSELKQKTATRAKRGKLCVKQRPVFSSLLPDWFIKDYLFVLIGQGNGTYFPFDNSSKSAL